VQRAFGILRALLLPDRAQIAGRRALAEDRGQRAVQRPGIIQVESLGHQRRLVRFRQPEDAGFELVHLGAGALPETHRHHAGRIATEAVEIEVADPVAQHVDHVCAQLWIGVVEPGHVVPVGNGRNDLARGVVLVEFGRLHHDAIPGGVVGHDVDDHPHPAAVRFGDQPLQVVLGAVVRIDGVVVAHGVRAAERAFALHLSDGMDGHEPDHVYPKSMQAIQARGHSVEVAGRREVAREDFVDHCARQPPGRSRGRREGRER
jgi:hypothetical protein